MPKYTFEDVEKFNQNHLEKFTLTKKPERIIFISDCLEPTLTQIIIKMALKNGYLEENIFIAGGPHFAEEKIAEYQPLAVIGIACATEIMSSFNYLNNIPAQGIMLDPAKCPGKSHEQESKVDLDEVKRILLL